MATGWFTDIMESIGKAIPNEISKTNSVTKYIPGWGQVLQVIGAIDSGSTAYSDVEERGGSGREAMMAGGQSAMSNMSGQGVDPGRYGSPNVNRDWANMIGQTANYFNYTQGGGVSPNMGGLMNIQSNPYFFKGTDKQNVENWVTRTDQTGSPYGTSISQDYIDRQRLASSPETGSVNIPYDQGTRTGYQTPQASTAFTPYEFSGAISNGLSQYFTPTASNNYTAGFSTYRAPSGQDVGNTPQGIGGFDLSSIFGQKQTTAPTAKSISEDEQVKALLELLKKKKEEDELTKNKQQTKPLTLDKGNTIGLPQLTMPVHTPTIFGGSYGF